MTRVALVLALAAALVSCRKDPAVEAALDSLETSYLDGCVAKGVIPDAGVRKACDDARLLLQAHGRLIRPFP